MNNFKKIPLAFIALAAAATLCEAQVSKERISNLLEVEKSRPLLRWDRPTYQNYSIDHFDNHPNHWYPYDDSRRTIYGPMGDFLVNGYDLYKWEERRTPGQVFGSAIFKPNEMYSLPWEKVYNSTAVTKDGYGDWGFSLFVADNMIARLSPLTLSMVDFNGFRFDLSLPVFKGTVLASRIERPHTYQETPTTWALEKTHFADDSTLLMGGRLQADLGIGSLGFNMVNSHVYHSTQMNNDRRGVIRPDHPLFDWLIVRFSDDSPDDGIAGSHLQDVTLILNGEPRPDIVPLVISGPAGIRPQVGTFSSSTGRFRATNYTLFRGARRYYRGRDEIPLFSDYLVRRDHELGKDISKVSNLDGIVGNFHIESPAGPLEANGDKEIAFLYDLTQEGSIESVEIEALLGNDYRVDVANLYEVNTRGKTYHAQYSTTFYETVARARDNVQDLSNLKPVRFQLGEDTGIFVYSADFNLTLPGVEVMGEFARSAVHARYPARLDGGSDFGASPRFSTKDNAYFVNATHWFRGGRLGAEAFSINPEFTTTYRTFLDKGNFGHTHLQGMFNETVYWDLVEDNDDADRMPDRRIGNIVGFPNDSQDYDLDGVQLGQDEDNDGFPDTNRDGDFIPDFEEPFLMYDVEPNIYTYGLDRNNNDEPDRREDDGLVDYPYDPDQRGVHLFAQFDLTSQLSLAAGHYSVNEIAGSGRNRSTYALVTLDVRGVGGRRLFNFENNFRRVQDDIRDEYLVIDESPIKNLEFSFRGLTQSMCSNCSGNNAIAGLHDRPPLFTSQFVPDVRSYQDSWVNESYMGLRLNPISSFKWHQKLRVRFNWQQGGELYNKTFQKERRLDFWTSVTRLEYTKHWGKLKITPQYKYMFLRLRDQERGTDLISEIRSIPILRIEYPLMSRTSLRAGFQGFGPFPYRLTDDTADRNSYEQRTAFVTITNLTGYFGYELVTTMGINKNHREYDTKFRDIRDFDNITFFVRGMIGFSEFGRPI